jgi:hypothetical protein
LTSEVEWLAFRCGTRCRERAVQAGCHLHRP